MQGKAPKFIGLGPCIWRDSPGGEAVPALVTRAGAVINCVVFPPESKIGVPKDSVRHIDDPEYHKFAVMQSGSGGNPPGCWDYTDEAKSLFALIEERKREGVAGKRKETA